MNVETKPWSLEKDVRVSISTIDSSQRQETHLRIEINPKVVLKGFLLLIIFLMFANFAAVIFQLNFYHYDVYRLTHLFTFDDETNIPTFYSSLALFFCAALLSIIAAAHKRNGFSSLPWFGLAAVFLLLSIDEAASVHEKLTIPFRDLLNTSGFLYFAWVIPYGIAAALFCSLYIRFLLRLPKKTMFLFIASGATYISGAAGFEMISAYRAYSHGVNDLIYSLITTCEEFLEILGIVIFIYSLLLYISERFGKFTITAGENASVDQVDFEKIA